MSRNSVRDLFTPNESVTEGENDQRTIKKVQRQTIVFAIVWRERALTVTVVSTYMYFYGEKADRNFLCCLNYVAPLNRFGFSAFLTVTLVVYFLVTCVLTQIKSSFEKVY